MQKSGIYKQLISRESRKERIKGKNMEWVDSSSQKLRRRKVTNKYFFHTANIIDYYNYILIFVTYFKISIIYYAACLKVFINQTAREVIFSNVITDEIHIKY